MTKAKMAHMLRSAAAITAHGAFVVIGTGAVIAQLETVPLALLQTREIDIYPDAVPDVDALSDLIDGSIGEGSPFDATFGYYAHGVGEQTAFLPADWRYRVTEVRLPGLPDVMLVCPDPNDIALSKLCAWREKDRVWLQQAVAHGVVVIQTMQERAARLTNPAAPPAAEVERRLLVLEQPLGPPNPGSTKRPA